MTAEPLKNPLGSGNVSREGRTGLLRGQHKLLRLVQQRGDLISSKKPVRVVSRFVEECFLGSSHRRVSSSASATRGSNVVVEGQRKI